MIMKTCLSPLLTYVNPLYIEDIEGLDYIDYKTVFKKLKLETGVGKIR